MTVLALAPMASFFSIGWAMAAKWFTFSVTGLVTPLMVSWPVTAYWPAPTNSGQSPKLYCRSSNNVPPGCHAAICARCRFGQLCRRRPAAGRGALGGHAAHCCAGGAPGRQAPFLQFLAIHFVLL